MVRTPGEDRPMITSLDFGLYVTFPSKEAAEAFSKSPLCSTPNEVVEGTLQTPLPE